MLYFAYLCYEKICVAAIGAMCFSCVVSAAHFLIYGRMLKMNQKQLAEIIAIIRKLEIDNCVDLTDTEKELMKQFIDFIKEQVR